MVFSYSMQKYKKTAETTNKRGGKFYFCIYLLKEATYGLKKDGSKLIFKDVKKIAKSEKLTRMLEEGFVKNCGSYENDVPYVACGPGVYDVLKKLQAVGRIRVRL